MRNNKISDTLTKNLNAQLELCEELEALADKLPHDTDAQNCLVLARSILPLLRQAHDFEEKILFPTLRAKNNESAPLHATLERLQFEHWEDESFAQELRECLIEFAFSRNEDQVNSISYMLRGFFEGVRRHIAFEREHLLPLLLQHPTS